jgi:hypothetical protein
MFVWLESLIWSGVEVWGILKRNKYLLGIVNNLIEVERRLGRMRVNGRRGGE